MQDHVSVGQEDSWNTEHLKKTLHMSLDMRKVFWKGSSSWFGGNETPGEDILYRIYYGLWLPTRILTNITVLMKIILTKILKIIKKILPLGNAV